MKQGEIWDLYLDPVQGSKLSGRRPAVIISGNLMNQYLQVVIVCPLTTKVKNYKGNVIVKPNQLNNLQQESEILIFHVCSVSKARLKQKIGEVNKAELNLVRAGLDDILRY